MVRWADLTREQRAAFHASIGSMPREQFDAQPIAPDLRDALDSLRPWADTDRVAGVLAAWMERRWGADAAEKVEPYDVAEELAELGVSNPAMDAESVSRVTVNMLRNVAQGRSPRDEGPPVTIEVSPKEGVRSSTHWRWRKLPDGGLSLLAYDLELARLVKAGVTPAAARRRLQRARKRAS